jgi:DNA polymerase I
MTPDSLEDFSEIWCVDFEFHQPPGELPQPICLVAHEIRSGRRLKLFRDEMAAGAPYRLDKNSLFVAFAAAAEFSCHLALGWQLPKHTLDLFFEFRNLTNSVDKVNQKASLLSALAYFNIPHATTEKKDSMRALAMRGGPWTQHERDSLLEYCESDVVPLPALLDKLAGQLSPQALSQALERGRYAKAVAIMEDVGVPIDTDTLSELRRKWVSIHLQLIAEVDQDFHVYEGVHFRYDLFKDWLDRCRITWPRTPTGRLSVEEDTFRTMALTYPELNPLRELRATLASMKLESLSVGQDGRNRTSLKPFTSVTSRNQPSNSSFIFGPAVWLRHLIKPVIGTAVAYVDFEQQEFGIAAHLSGDEAMKEAYAASDPYLEFAKQAGAVPPGATKKTHSAVRDQFKSCALAVMYGMTPKGLSIRIGRSENEAQRLIEKHQETYPKFWEWSDRVVTHMQLEGVYSTKAGWQVKRMRWLNEHHKRSLRNFPMQGTGADMLRLSCCLATEAGIRICCPVHDAVLIEAPLSRIGDRVSAIQAVMAEASRDILDGFELRTEAKVFTDRFEDPRGMSTWKLVTELLERCRPGEEQFELVGLSGGDDARL